MISSVFVICKRLQERGIVTKKEKKDWTKKSVIIKNSASSKKKNDKDVIYIKITAGDHSGATGYALKKSLNGKNPLVQCSLYKNGIKSSPYVKREHIKILTPHKL